METPIITNVPSFCDETATDESLEKAHATRPFTAGRVVCKGLDMVVKSQIIVEIGGLKRELPAFNL